MSTNPISGWIVPDGGENLILGVGATKQAALDDAETQIKHAHLDIDRADLEAYPATAALMACVEQNGGSGPYAWDIKRGVAYVCHWRDDDFDVDPDMPAEG